MQILRESEGPNVLKPASQTITCVPVRLIRSVLRHKADFQPSLFEHYEDSDGYYDTRHLPPEQINQFKNTFTGHEIELLTAILSRAGFEKSGKQYQWNRHAEFQSAYELCKIASGSKARSDKDITPYLKALKTLDVPHWFLYKENEKVFLEKSRPINITYRNDGIRIEIAENIVRNPDYFKYIAINSSSLFKGDDIQRVSTAHIKLYMYLAVRSASKDFSNGSGILSIQKIATACGIDHYFEQRHGDRAIKLIHEALLALQKAKILESVQFLSSGQVRIKANMFHFKRSAAQTSGADEYTTGANAYTIGAEAKS